MSATARVGSEAHRPSLEMPGGEDKDFIQCLLTDVVVGHPVYLALLVGSEPRDGGPLGIAA
jgi:hypothetical protein